MLPVKKFVMALAELPESCEFSFSSVLNGALIRRANKNIRNGNIPECCVGLFGKSLILCVVSRLPPDDQRWCMALGAMQGFVELAHAAALLNAPLSREHYANVARLLRATLGIEQLIAATQRERQS